MTHWNAHGKVPLTMRKRFEMAAIPEVNWTSANGRKDSDYDRFFCNHVRRVRAWVADHPTLSLIEFSIEDPHAGHYMASLFPVDAADWGNSNENKDIHPANSTRWLGAEA